MPQYRVEISKNNRAGCKDSVCKHDAVKIGKGEIRFGTWAEIQEHGSWQWKHWGCVSGKQLLNLRSEADKGNGDYNFDVIDGYDELDDHPEIQEKIRRCVKQAHIDPEDFNGDAEKNVPGSVGIHLTVTQRAKKEEALAENESRDEAKDKKKKKKRNRGSAADDDEGIQGQSQPQKKPRKPKAVPPQESDKTTSPPNRTRKSSSKKVKGELDADDEPPARGRRASVTTKSKASVKAIPRRGARLSSSADKNTEVNSEDIELPKPDTKTKRQSKSASLATENTVNARRSRSSKS